MKKLFLICCMCTLAILQFGCAQQDKDKIDLEKMTAGEILNELTEQGYPMETKVEFNEEEDSNEYPWNVGCTSAVTWLIPDSSIESGGRGAIEVYETSGTCKMRIDSLIGLSSYPAANKYYLQVDNILIHIPQSLNEQEALQYQAALQAMAQGKLPEPYTPVTLNSPSQWNGYIETFPEYDYAGTKNANFADRHFELNDEPQNIPEELVTLHFYYNIAGEYDKLYNLCGSEPLQISAKNTEKNFKNGQYTQEFIVRQLSTLSLDEFVKKDLSSLEIIKRDILANKLIEYTCVKADHSFTTPPEMQGQAQCPDGDYTFYYLCGKSQQDSNWKLYEVYWE